MATQQQEEKLTQDQGTHDDNSQDYKHEQGNQDNQDLKKPVDPPGLIWDSPLESESCPFSFDPTNNIESELGTAAVLHLTSNYETLPDDDVNTFLNHISYDQLTGMDDVTPEKHGLESQNEPSIARSFDSRAYAMATWHRVVHKNIDPKHLIPYLGFRPLDIVKKTLDVTTQLAKMVIRYPLRRHIKSWMQHMNFMRLYKVISNRGKLNNSSKGKQGLAF